MSLPISTRVLESGRAYITQRYKPTSHKGIDLVNCNAFGKHTTGWVVAHSDGKVIKVVDDIDWTSSKGSSYGNYVIIEHKDGFKTLYAHLKYGKVKAVEGQEIAKGERVGFMGNTGHSCGAHLHFEVRKDDCKIDPTPYLDADLREDPWEPAVGEVCKFIGDTHYSNANATEGKPCKGEEVIIKRIYKLGKSKHPYNVQSTDEGNVHGWVDEDDLEEIK